MTESEVKGEITDLLAAWRLGDPSAPERLMPLIYEDLRHRAHQQLRRMPHATLCTTGLVHEAYLKLAASPSTHWQDRHHFFAVASKAMRSVVVDYARKRFARKRGGPQRSIELDEEMPGVEENAAEILAIHEALDRLAVLDRRLSDLVELRFFGGLSVEEIASLRNVAAITVKRDWSKARTVLHQLLEPAT